MRRDKLKNTKWYFLEYCGHKKDNIQEMCTFEGYIKGKTDLLFYFHFASLLHVFLCPFNFLLTFFSAVINSMTSNPTPHVQSTQIIINTCVHMLQQLHL